MKSLSRPRARVRVGIALDSDRLVARAVSPAERGEEWSFALGGAPDADGTWPELSRAMSELRASLPAGVAVIASVVVLPPLVRLRTIDLPPLRPDERRRALTRDAARWFVGAREPQVVDAVPVRGGGVVAAALSARYAESIVSAAAGAGILVRAIQPAPWAWAALVEKADRVRVRALVVPGASGAEVVRLDAGAVVESPRVRPGDAMSAQVRALLDAWGATGSAAVMVGTAGQAESLVATLGIGRMAGRDDPMALAAAMAASVRGPDLMPDGARSAQRLVVSRTARWLALAAAALVLLAAGVELWGVHRQLAAVERERAEIHARVERAIASRDSATTLEAQYAAVSSDAQTAPRWTAVLVDLTRALPGDAHLTSLMAAGDSVTLAGEATNAAAVFDALRRDLRIAGVRADAPIRREFAPDRTQVERFSVVVRLAAAGLTAMPAAARDEERP